MSKEKECKHEDALPFAIAVVGEQEKVFIAMYCAECDEYFYIQGQQFMDV